MVKLIIYKNNMICGKRETNRPDIITEGYSQVEVSDELFSEPIENLKVSGKIVKIDDVAKQKDNETKARFAEIEAKLEADEDLTNKELAFYIKRGKG